MVSRRRRQTATAIRDVATRVGAFDGADVHESLHLAAQLGNSLRVRSLRSGALADVARAAAARAVTAGFSVKPDEGPLPSPSGTSTMFMATTESPTAAITVTVFSLVTEYASFDPSNVGPPPPISPGEVIVVYDVFIPPSAAPSTPA